MDLYCFCWANRKSEYRNSPSPADVTSQSAIRQRAPTTRRTRSGVSPGTARIWMPAIGTPTPNCPTGTSRWTSARPTISRGFRKPAPIINSCSAITKSLSLNGYKNSAPAGRSALRGLWAPTNVWNVFYFVCLFCVCFPQLPNNFSFLAISELSGDKRPINNRSESAEFGRPSVINGLAGDASGGGSMPRWHVPPFDDWLGWRRYVVHGLWKSVVGGNKVISLPRG